MFEFPMKWQVRSMDLDYELPAREKEIGQRLRAFRERLNIPRTVFATQIGIGGEKLSHYEAGRARLRYGVFRAISKAFYLQPLWLLTGEGIMQSDAPFDDSAFDSQINPKSPFAQVCETVLKERLTGEDWAQREIVERLIRDTTKMHCYLESLEGDKPLEMGVFAQLEVLAVTLRHFAEKASAIVKRQREIERRREKRPTRRRPGFVNLDALENAQWANPHKPLSIKKQSS